MKTNDLFTKVYLSVTDLTLHRERLRLYLSGDRHNKDLVAPSRLMISDSDTVLYKNPSPLYFTERTSIWEYLAQNEAAESRCVLKVVLLHNLWTNSRDVESKNHREREIMQLKMNEEMRCLNKFYDAVVPHCMLAEGSAEAGNTSRVQYYEMKAVNSVTMQAHHVLWGAQVMPRARCTLAAFVQSLRNHPGRLVAMPTLIHRVMICLSRLLRCGLLQMDFKWENCGLFYNDDMLEVRILDTATVVRVDDKRATISTTYPPRFDRVTFFERERCTPGETVVLWSLGVGFLQLANPYKYKEIARFFHHGSKVDKDVTLAEFAKNVAEPENTSKSYFWYVLALRCLRVGSRKTNILRVRHVQNIVSRFAADIDGKVSYPREM